MMIKGGASALDLSIKAGALRIDIALTTKESRTNMQTTSIAQIARESVRIYFQPVTLLWRWLAGKRPRR